MSLTPISFTGFSDFADDFQAILERSFQVAMLPIQRLQSDQGLLLAEQQELGNLASVLQDLRTTFASLGILGAQGGLQATSSDTSVATVSLVGESEPLTFDIDVTSAATKAQESSLSSLASQTSGGLTADGIYELTVGSTVTNIDILTIGSGRTAGTTGSETPSPKVSVGVDFSNGLAGSITAVLESFFVAGSAPSNISSGDTVSVTFAGTNGTINETITTDALTGSETTADLATALNDKIAANANLAGKLTFSDEGGKLKLVVSDTAGEGFTFTSTSSGTIVSGLEDGGTVGGHSAEEIAAALNAQVALDESLSDAGVTFTALNGEVKVNGDVDFEIAVTDNPQGTGFASGLAGTHSVSQFDNTLQGLRDFINNQSDTLGVTATIINTSSDADNPEYRLTLSTNETGATTLLLRDSSAQDLLTTTNQGTDAVFTVDGTSVTNSSNTISDFAPGLSLTIVGPGSATVSTSTDRSGISNLLSDVAVKYNAAVDFLKTQIGEDAGNLSGHILVRTASSFLRQITGFSGSGDIRSIVELGLELDDEGVMTFNSTTFNALSDSDLEDVVTFIGSTTEGFAGSAHGLLTELADPVTGQIEEAIDVLQDSDAALEKQILQQQERVDQLIVRLEEQFAAADRLIARLEGQQDLLKALFADITGDNND